MPVWGAFIVGLSVALLAEFLPIHSLRYTPRDQWPEWANLRTYWALSIAGCLIGGGVAGGYAAATKMTWYLAANVGAAWPSIINGFARTVPAIKPNEGTVD